MKNSIAKAKAVKVLETLFARHGFPFQIVSDNGTTFTSAEFKQFVTKHGIKHTFSPVRHTAMNGAAENFVGIFRDKVYKIIRNGLSLDHAITQFLLDYRTTAHLTRKASPTSLIYEREMRTRFFLLRP